eukprot:3405161-Pyramimonas_sp.AAC.1
MAARHGTMFSYYPLFSAVSIRYGGGRSVTNQPGMVTVADTSRTENKQTMYTVVYNPECNLKPQDVSVNKIDFDAVSKSKLGAVQHARPRLKTANEPSRPPSMTPSHCASTTRPPRSHCNLSIETDSDWASDHTNRKSLFGNCVFYNGSLLNFLVSKQAT